MKEMVEDGSLFIA